ncbi:MAG: alpha/beta hydrolase [Actinobacteria bacterium 13_1_40CM_2_65_8]|nr:MAG: alpha/beta hydrolase [Actinobacteria bacterium 13_1_40CM_2_65_8]
MPRAHANGIEIEYEAFGDPNAAPLLLVMGLGAQMLSWDESFCEQLAARGFYVIRFDNRDSGLSTKMEEAGEPDVMAALAGHGKPAYSLDDLADDAIGLLDALGIGAAHIVGASMGGFIVQLMAINHADRVISLTSIMSGPGGHDTVSPLPEGAEVLTRVAPETRDGRIEHGVWIRRVLNGSGPFDEAEELRRTTRAVDRSYYPPGTGRQLVAVFAAHSRLERLAQVKVPTLVIHGIDDPLVPVENGRRVAAAVPGARLLEFEGMGHNMPERFWPQILDAIVDTARKANVLQPG